MWRFWLDTAGIQAGGEGNHTQGHESEANLEKQQGMYNNKYLTIQETHNILTLWVSFSRGKNQSS